MLLNDVDDDDGDDDVDDVVDDDVDDDDDDDDDDDNDVISIPGRGYSKFNDLRSQLYQKTGKQLH